MNKQERDAMVWQLKRETAELYADMAARRERAMIEDTAPTIVSKAFDDDERPNRELIEQSQRNYEARMQREQQAQPQPDWNDWFIANFDARIKGYLDLVADEVGAASGDTMKPVLMRLAKLEAETALLRSLLDGAVINIKSKTNAAA